MRKDNKQKKGDLVLNLPTKLRYYLDPIAILIASIIIVLAINYAFRLIS